MSLRFNGIGRIGTRILERTVRNREAEARRKEEARIKQVTPINQQAEQVVRLQSLFGRRNAIQANARDTLSTEAAEPELNIRTRASAGTATDSQGRRRRAIGPYTTGVNI